MVVSQNGGTQQSWVFLLKWSFWGVLGVPPLKETPILKYGNLYGTVHIYTSTWITTQDPPFVFTAAMFFFLNFQYLHDVDPMARVITVCGESTVQSLRNHPSGKVLTILLWSMCFQCQAQQPRGKAGQRTSEVSLLGRLPEIPKLLTRMFWRCYIPFTMEGWNTLLVETHVGFNALPHVAAIAYYNCHNAPSFLDPARPHNQVTPAMLALECKPITQKLNMTFVRTKLTSYLQNWHSQLINQNFALGYESNPRIRKVKIATKYQSRCQQNKLTSSEASVAQRDSPNTLSKWDQHLCWKHTCPRCSRSTIGVH